METSGNNCNNDYCCNICNKKYNTRAGIWKHNQKYHNDKTTQNAPELLITTQNYSKNTPNIETPIINNKYVCNYCNHNFTRSFNLNRHLLSCKNKNNNDKSKDEIITILQQTIKESTEMFEEQLKMCKKQLLDIMNKQCKVHPKTLQKMNKQLNANTISENNNTNNGTINNNTNNGTINNNTINIIALGHEELSDVLTKKEKLTILKNKYNCLPYFIKYIHFNNKFPQFYNIKLTNMQNNIAYKFDYTQNQFVAIDKNEFLNELMDARMYDIEAFYEELESELDDKTKNIIEIVLDKMEVDPAYREEKKKEIKLLIYNNRNKIGKDLEIII